MAPTDDHFSSNFPEGTFEPDSAVEIVSDIPIERSALLPAAEFGLSPQTKAESGEHITVPLLVVNSLADFAAAVSAVGYAEIAPDKL